MNESQPVAIVTGGAKGIGAACAQMLGQAQFNVLLSYVNSQAEANSIVSSCLEYGNDAACLKSDVSKDDDCVALAKTALDRWGRIDVLVNNAGITRFGDPSKLSTLNADDFEKIFSVNVTGTFQMTRAVSTSMKGSPFASVVNISSHSGFSGIGSSIAYAASKGALNTLTLSLARSLAPDIRVNAVCPGFVDTDWMKPKMDGQALEMFKQDVTSLAPLNRLVTPEEVAETVGWLALEGKSITGQLIVIDGGAHLTLGSPI